MSISIKPSIPTDHPSEPTPSPNRIRRLRQEIQHVFEEFEASFRRKYPALWLATLVGPFVLTVAILFLLGLFHGWGYVGKLLTTAVVTFFGAGRFVILGGNTRAVPFSSEFLFAMVTYMDLMVAILLSFHIGFMFKAPLIGPKVSELVADGRFILQRNPWMRRMTFLGLVAFVVFPLAATGSVGGSIFGRLLGMSRLPTFIGIAIGSILGNGIMYFGSTLFKRFLDENSVWTTVGGIAVIVGLIIFLERRYRKLKRATLAELEQEE